LQICPKPSLTFKKSSIKSKFLPCARDVLLPAFDIPDAFKDPKDEEDEGKRGENNFLKHLTLRRCKKKRYGEITAAIKERLDFELSVIEKNRLTPDIS
jgi:DNA polymerase-3 subunit alpha